MYSTMLAYMCVLPSKAISAALGGLANLEGTLFREPCPVVRILAAASREALEKHSHTIAACSMDLAAMGLLAHHHCYYHALHTMQHVRTSPPWTLLAHHYHTPRTTTGRTGSSTCATACPVKAVVPVPANLRLGFHSIFYTKNMMTGRVY